MDLPEMLQCEAAQAVVDPIYISQDNFYDHLAASLQRWQSFGDLIFVLSNYEVVPTNHFLLSTLSAVVQALPKGHNMESYFLLKDIDPWSAKCMINFFYAQEMVIPRYSLENLNRVLDTLEVNIGGKFVDGAETVHFAMSHLYKRDTLEKIWQARHASFDLKIITKDRREVHAHWAVLAASSEQLYALFQGPISTRPRLIVLSEFESVDVDLLLQFCYKGEVQIPLTQAASVCKLAEVLGVKSVFHTMADLGFKFKRNEVFKQGNTRLTCFEQKDNSRRLNLKTLFEQETLSDLQLISSNHSFKVHSAILSVSPYFQPIFQQTDWRHCLIFLSEFPLESVQAFVDLVYYGEVICQGRVEDFIADMVGLIDFTQLPINSVENLEPPVVAEKQTPVVLPEVPIPQLQTVKEQIPTPPKLLTYKCSVCSEIFYSRKRLKLHTSSEHPQPNKCEQCDQTFESEAELKTHLRKTSHKSSTSGMDLFCQHCGKSFSQSSSLRKHLKLHDINNSFYECDICHRTCLRKDYLEEHMRTHTGRKPFKCPTCGKRFVGKTGLNHHTKTHGTLRKESVCEVCGKEYTRKALWTHMKSHNKQFHCSVCNIYFATSGTLKNHEARKHFELKQYSCDLCSKAFSLRGELNRHKRAVHEPGPDTAKEKLQCGMCNKKFAKSSSLEYHKRVHLK